MALKQSSASAVLGNNFDTPWFAKDTAAIEVQKLRASIHRALDVLAVKAFFAALPRVMAYTPLPKGAS